jgi:hypothetical protein
MKTNKKLILFCKPSEVKWFTRTHTQGQKNDCQCKSPNWIGSIITSSVCLLFQFCDLGFNYVYVGPEVFTAVTMKNTVFWNVAP